MRLLGWLREERETHLLGLLRLAIATLLLLFTLKLARGLAGGYFGDIFHLPLLPEAWVPSRNGYALLLGVQGLGCVLAMLGLGARPALLVAALCGLYGLFCDRLQFHNNRYTLLLVALLVPFTPCDRSFVLRRSGDAADAPRPGPRWAAWLIGVQLSLVYLSSSLGKLFDPDWRGGQVMLLRFAQGQPLADAWLPPSLAGLLAAPWFAEVASLAAIGTELFLALGLWFPRTRVLALWLGVVFHVGIEVASNVELFSYTMLSGYVVFATPELGERRLSWNAGRQAHRFQAILRRLDFLSRFQHSVVEAQGPLLVAHDRTGTPHLGLAACREVARATPLLFPLWLPLRLLTWRRLAS